MLYPLFFQPILKDKIWGGSKLNNLLNKQTSSTTCGESWEISTVENDISIVSNGKLKGNNLIELIAKFKSELVGKQLFEKFGKEFPLLIKFLDASEDLSIQVHPNDSVAKVKHNSLGKTEMWYVCQADNNSKLISGFKEKLTKAEFSTRVKNNTILQSLNNVEVSKGDVFYLPAGRVHTIGKGLLIAEIQQTSDVTYRIYDFDRTDTKGNKRELHIEEATEALDFTPLEEAKSNYTKEKNTPYNLVNSPYFVTNKIDIDKNTSLDYSNDDQFKILMCVEGSCEIIFNKQTYNFEKGQTTLIPASLSGIDIITNNKPVEILEIFAR